MSKDYYSILGVSKNASEEEIKKAFRKKAHEHHPDKGGDAQKFKDINEAYQVLGDKKKRAAYDQFGSAAFEQGGPFGGGSTGSPFGGGFGQGFGFDFGGAGFDFGEAGDLGDVLGEMFGMGGAGSRRSRAARGQDIEVDVELSFRESVFGVKRTLNLYKQTSCSRCDMSGAEPGSKIIECATCHGAGEVRESRRTIFGTMQTAVVCSSCHGRGKKSEKLCSRCHGSGTEKREEEIGIEIPAGIDHEQMLKVAGKGEAPPFAKSGGRAGDLYVRVRVKPDARFERDGRDIVSTQEVPFTVLALGGSVSIETIDGAISVHLSEGTRSGTVITLRGHGVTFASGRRGDHHVRITAEIPKKLTKEQKKLLEDLREKGL